MHALQKRFVILTRLLIRIATVDIWFMGWHYRVVLVTSSYSYGQHGVDTRTTECATRAGSLLRRQISAIRS